MCTFLYDFFACCQRPHKRRSRFLAAMDDYAFVRYCFIYFSDF
jgi:hypothetical protein